MNNHTKQLAYWQGKFGDDYTKRNTNVKLFEKRKSFFEKLLNQNESITSILEVGCNIGGNLVILHKIDKKLALSAIEPNSKASKIAQENLPLAEITNKSVYDLEPKRKYDLVFTAGVLIHINENDLSKALRKIYNASKSYILTIEYYAPRTIIIPYRQLEDALFKRPYNKIWHKQYPKLHLVEKGYLDKKQGFDDCRWWLFKK